MQSIHFALSGSGSNVPLGPMMSPRPGPTLEIDVTAPDMAVRKSSPTKDRAMASIVKQSAYMKKKLMTDPAASLASGLLL